jgi:hypothetical protein
MLNKQVALATQGMDEVLVSMDTFYTTMMDWARAADIENPERYWVDPRSPQSMQAAEGKRQQQAQQTNMQNLLITQAIKLEQVRSAIQKYQTDVETQFKYYDANLSAQVEEAKIVGKSTMDFLTLLHGPKPKENKNATDKKDSDEGTEGTSSRITAKSLAS